MNKPLFVFYEDKLAQSENNFGPHVLAIACLIDARGNAETRWELGKRILHLCKNGVSKLIADATLFQDATRKVLAPDEDRIRGELALVPATTASEVVAELGRRTNTPEQQIVLIVRNMDDVARNAAAAMGAERSEAEPAGTGSVLSRARRDVRSKRPRPLPRLHAVVQAVDRDLERASARDGWTSLKEGRVPGASCRAAFIRVRRSGVPPRTSQWLPSPGPKSPDAMWCVLGTRPSARRTAAAAFAVADLTAKRRSPT